MGDEIAANLIDTRTKLGADRELRLSDLPLQAHERVYRERVPLAPAAATVSSAATSDATPSWQR